MQFWVGWQMWQKLCFVLAGILAVVLTYSFCVLLRNRRKLRRATAEAYQKAEQDTEAQNGELRPMLTRLSDIPFGARALQRGVQIEGIWVSSSETLDQPPKEPEPAISPPSTPLTGSPLKKVSSVDANDDKEPLPPAPQVTAPLRVLNGNSVGDEVVPSSPMNINRASLHSTRTAATNLEPRPSHEPGVRLSRQWFGPRSAWITKAPETHKRKSGFVDGKNVRPSSEEIRRRFSKLFDEQLQAQPMEAFRLGPMLPGTEGDRKRMSRLSRPL